MERKIDPNTGCYCDFSHRMTGDGCDICNPEYAEELRKEAELEGAKNTEQANQPDSQYDLGGLILPGSMWAEP